MALRLDLDYLFVSYLGTNPDVPLGKYFTIGYISVCIFSLMFENPLPTHDVDRHILFPWVVFISPLGLILMVNWTSSLDTLTSELGLL